MNPTDMQGFCSGRKGRAPYRWRIYMKNGGRYARSEALKVENVSLARSPCPYMGIQMNIQAFTFIGNSMYYEQGSYWIAVGKNGFHWAYAVYHGHNVIDSGNAKTIEAAIAQAMDFLA